MLPLLHISNRLIYLINRQTAWARHSSGGKALDLCNVYVIALEAQCHVMIVDVCLNSTYIPISCFILLSI